VDKFVIQDHDDSRPLRSPQFRAKSTNAKYSLGLLSDIWARSSTCSLCYLVAQSVNAQQVSLTRTELIQAECTATWEIDGRGGSSNGFVRPRTRRIHLRWDLDGLEDSYLVFMAPENHIRFNSDAKNIWEKESLYLGRTISPYGNNTVLMKSWLDGCCRGHTGQYLIERDRDFENMIRQSYFGVIDVLDMRLIALPYEVLGRRKIDLEDRYSGGDRSPSSDSDATGARAGDRQGEEILKAADFLALSYVWGPGNQKPPYTTTLENILVHRNPGGLERCLNQLPQVVRDAIDLVRLLGFRYLWVDSLCIVQNSERSWKLNASVMDLIYSNAILTICAADGATSDTGLNALYSTPDAIDQRIAQCTPDVRLMVSHLAESGIRTSVWNSRVGHFRNGSYLDAASSSRRAGCSSNAVLLQCQRISWQNQKVLDGRLT
jgi:Heterokaryon incompatibility protein (HET)